jgi:hypothetical protein
MKSAIASGEVHEPTPIGRPLSKMTTFERNIPIVTTKAPTLRPRFNWRPSGSECIILSRIGNNVSKIHNTPDQNTAPRDWPTERPITPIAEKATKPFISSPGASTNGNRAHTPMSIEESPEAIAVANKTELASKPPFERIAGFTTRIYARLKKVEKPARSSV